MNGSRDSSVVLPPHLASPATMRGIDAAKRMVAELEKQAGIVNELRTNNGGQLTVTGPLDGEIEVNVGGTVLCVPRKPLLLPGVCESVIAYLLLYHLDGLPKDTEGRPFLDADPVYLEWLRDEITNVGVADAQGESHEIVLNPPHDTDVSSLFWHELFFSTKTGLGTLVTKDADESEAAATSKNPIDIIKASASDVEAAMTDLVEAEKELKRFHRAIGPFFKSPDGDDEIRSVRVLGKTVSTTEATLAHAGRDKRLYATFHSGASVSCIRPDHFTNVVDFARRQHCVSPGSIVKPPTAQNQQQLAVDCGMYGLSMETANSPVLWADELQWIIEATGKHNVTTTRLFKSSRDGFGYGPFLNKVVGKSGLLFALRDGDSHRFGCFVDGPLTPPDDPLQTNLYDVTVFFFSLSGAYETPTKIEISEERQSVEVAGTQGVVKTDKGEPRANMSIACGYLWLGFAQPGPAADLSSCHQWIKKDLLPNGYSCSIDSKGSGTLAQSMNFT
ncbi:unnamed protein product [Vitrella brassicaformis CCMP3155]|uniref:TLDc domain-containing protein n=3 Tax=Vitrella brassicaformis TaxID=1169539 RepID=A0A0G4GYK8_VITBC|nr:unnamed protein product [Vitrella brassicaformis CCMP3155]|eukprot:CEM36249.1 unnamed protein product [Vitrella brassicaformis CCMP3155]